MRIDPGLQGTQALLSLACGPVLGLSYDLLMAALRRARAEKLAPFCYLLFSLLAAVLLFLLGSIAGGGELRLFMPLGVGLGGMVYLLLLRRPGQWLAEQLTGLLAALIRLLLLPFRVLLLLLKKFSKILKYLFHYAGKWYKIKREFVNSAYCTCPAEETDENSEIRYRYRYSARAADPDGVCHRIPFQNQRPHRRGRAGSQQASG